MASAGAIGVFVLLTIAAISIGCLLTGYTPRSYPTLEPSASVVVAGHTRSLEELASTFQPQLFLPEGAASPPAPTMWWEAIDAEDSIALVYHPVWQDERHPVPALHWIYYVYRGIVYGVPVRDIEYIQINVNRSDGSIQRVRYEGSSSRSYEDWVNEHRHVAIDRVGAQYIETVTTKENSEPKTRTVRTHGPQLQFGIATWSHQLVLLEGSTEQYSDLVNMPLEHLVEQDYVRYKLARRSQGDFATREGFVSVAARWTIAVVILFPYLLLRYRHRFKHRRTGETNKKRQCSLNELQCPYCHAQPFNIRFDSTEAKTASPKAKVDETPPHEVEALPYARDIGKVDPPKEEPELRGNGPDELRGRWGKVGEDFYGELSWESIGILHWERGQEIYYCVARCPHCQGLLDVFANFTEERRLSDIWPHLLGRSADSDQIRIYEPNSKLSRCFGSTRSVLAFLMLLYFGSIIPNMVPYFQQPVFLFHGFWEENSSTLLLRGIVILALFLLLLLRERYIKLFRDAESFKALFKIREPGRGLIYWINFAVSRFVGYQKEGGLLSLTQVMVIGGLSSSIILFGAWILARTGILEANASQNSYVMLAELVFWLIVAYTFGIITWNISAVPNIYSKGA